MMQCQNCGDTQGPWVYTKKDGILCEDCHNYNEVVEKLVNLCKTHRKCQTKNTLDIVAFVDGIENKVYDELGLQ